MDIRVEVGGKATELAAVEEGLAEARVSNLMGATHEVFGRGAEIMYRGGGAGSRTLMFSCCRGSKHVPIHL